MACLELLLHKALVQRCDQHLILMEVRDLHPECVLSQDQPLTLYSKFCLVLFEDPMSRQKSAKNMWTKKVRQGM